MNKEPARLKDKKRVDIDQGRKGKLYEESHRPTTKTYRGKDQILVVRGFCKMLS
jgi:hypothetical protein